MGGVYGGRWGGGGQTCRVTLNRRYPQKAAAVQTTSSRKVAESGSRGIANGRGGKENWLGTANDRGGKDREAGAWPENRRIHTRTLEKATPKRTIFGDEIASYLTTAATKKDRATEPNGMRACPRKRRPDVLVVFRKQLPQNRRDLGSRLPIMWFGSRKRSP